MSSLVPLRRTYSALPCEMCSSCDLSHSSDPNEITLRLGKSTPRTIPRYSFLIRFIIFILLESGYIALVSNTLHRPIILDLSLSLTSTEMKGVVTATAIFWHALVVFSVKDILLSVFSAEWIGQNDRSRNLTLQELDSVSRLTSGFLDQIKHCISRRATHPFRLAFLSFLLLILLNGLGPSAIGVDLIPYESPSIIEVANVTGEVTTEVVYRAAAIVQLEVMEHVATAGFSGTQPNILIPWPFPSHTTSGNFTMRYDSDVIRHNLSCSWSMPSSFTTAPSSIEFGGTPWASSVLTGFGTIPAVIPLFSYTSSSLVLFLFVHSNMTNSFQEDIPSSLLDCQDGFWIENLRQWLAPEPCPLLLSLLVCDPQLEILPATINVSLASLEATISSGPPKVENILMKGAYNLFSSSLSSITFPLSIGGGGTSTFSSQMFFVTDENDTLQPLSLEQITQNMTNALVSSAKPYLSGYIGPTRNRPFLLDSPEYLKVNTSAVMQEQKMALVGNKPFFVAVCVTVGLLVVLLGAVVVITRPNELESFDLETILKKFR